jgi:hypothetical protein
MIEFMFASLAITVVFGLVALVSMLGTLYLLARLVESMFGVKILPERGERARGFEVPLLQPDRGTHRTKAAASVVAATGAASEANPLPALRAPSTLSEGTGEGGR